MAKPLNPYNKVYEDEWWDFWKVIAIRRVRGVVCCIAQNFDHERKTIPLNEFPPPKWERVNFDPFNPQAHNR